MNNPYAVIQTILVTEKATEMADGLNKYSFKVNPKARKAEIRQAVESIFDDVKVSSVNIMNQLGKRKRMRSAKYGRRADWKKAIVTLSEGSIDIL
jgi:large subunit ribosomal protein L23